MYFDSLADVFSMAGHGVYVWSAYGVSFAVIVGFLVQPVIAYRQQTRGLQRRSQASRS